MPSFPWEPPYDCADLPLQPTRAYRAGAAVAILTAFLTVWTTIVRDDGNGIGFLLLVLTAMVGVFAAWFRPAGMARAMLGVAIMQALLAVAIATAPSSANLPDATFKALLASAGFTVLWLLSAVCFWVAERESANPSCAARGGSGSRANPPCR